MKFQKIVLNFLLVLKRYQKDKLLKVPKVMTHEIIKKIEITNDFVPNHPQVISQNNIIDAHQTQFNHKTKSKEEEKKCCLN